MKRSIFNLLVIALLIAIVGTFLGLAGGLAAFVFSGLFFWWRALNSEVTSREPAPESRDE